MKIEKAIYEGYLWYSDAATPLVIDHEEFELEITDESNPFVVEAHLFNRSENHSISIKYIDGHHYMGTFQVTDSDIANKRIYLSNRMNNRKLAFAQRWKKSEDPLCEGMETYIPGELVFIGFESSK